MSEKNYPSNYSDEDLRSKSEELSKRILTHNHNTDNLENLIRDSVLFNVTYIEQQNRATIKSTKQMVALTWVGAFVAVASLLVAWMSYEASGSNDDWQQKQLELLKAISEHTSTAKSPTKVIPDQMRLNAKIPNPTHKPCDQPKVAP